ncbi:MAG: hypothetical protein HKN74_14570 [Acidimicrobiia bacterium]|nr:hypothetical protein [Acidimicrobiia bacterium]
MKSAEQAPGAMTWDYRLMDGWPALAWCARLEAGGATGRVLHGPGVEILADGFCEAVWDGDFADGAFDRTDLVFGSGGRLARDGAVFVSSGTTVDRLHWHETNGTWTISNSLAALLVEIGGTVDAADRGWFRFFESIIHGLDAYDRALASSAGPVTLTYFQNVSWDGTRLRLVSKPIPQRSLESFEDYAQFLESSLAALGENLSDPRRKYSLRPLATVSTGYDSPASAAVGRSAGLEETLSIARGRGDVDDDGSKISARLGLTPIVGDRAEALTHTELIPLFIASDAKGEDLYFAGSGEHLAGRFLISGYSGSRVWDTTDVSYAGLRRGDQSGLSHTEARLHLGYLHCPVPFLAGTQEAEIRRIGRSAEMKPWSVASNYDRPVCRRIVEETGVPGEWFGQDKKAASVLLFDRRTPLPAGLQADFEQWLTHHGLINPVWKARRLLTGIPRMILRGLQRFDPDGRRPVIGRLSREGRLQRYAFQEPMFDYLFPWALDRAMQKYR